MTEKRVKAWANRLFYLAAAIGMFDMTAQSISNGCARPIQSTLEFVFRTPSATPLPAHCVVPVEIVVKESE